MRCLLCCCVHQPLRYLGTQHKQALPLHCSQFQAEALQDSTCNRAPYSCHKSLLSLCALQVQSNALAALEAIDVEICNEVLRQGCITGDRINGLCDGETGDW
jgi:hypothetical protein